MSTSIENTNIPTGWVETTLGEIVDFVVDNRGKTPPVIASGFELLEVNAVSENRREPDYSKVSKFVDQETFENWFRKGTIKKGDVLIPTVGTIGNASYSNEDRGTIAQNLIALRTNADNDGLFLYYFLTAPNIKRALLNLDIGGVQPSIKVPHLLNMSVLFPPLPEQQAIASVLSAFDDKIELLREENKTLEAIGQTMFAEWFGKYSPERPEEFPEGWRVGKLGEVCGITSGKRPEKISDFKDEQFQIPLIGATKIMGYVEKYLFEGKTLVIGRVGTHGEIQKFNEQIYPSDNTLVIMSDNFVFVYQILRSIDYGKMNRGAVQPLITQTDLKNYPIILPTEEVLLNFKNAMTPIFGKIEDNDSQIQSLSKTRDELLPRLMSGEVRISKFDSVTN